MTLTDEMKDWLKAKIAEHEAASQQMQAQANAQMGAAQAYRILLEQDKPKED